MQGLETDPYAPRPMRFRAFLPLTGRRAAVLHQAFEYSRSQPEEDAGICESKRGRLGGGASKTTRNDWSLVLLRAAALRLDEGGHLLALVARVPFEALADALLVVALPAPAALEDLSASSGA